MEIRLLPPPVDFSDSYDLVYPARGALVASGHTQLEIVHPPDSYAWPASGGRSGSHRIYGTLVQDSPSRDTANNAGNSAWEYVSGWAWSKPIQRTAVAHYLRYSRFAVSKGKLIDLYA